MSEMVERVARAMYEDWRSFWAARHGWADPAWEGAHEGKREHYLRCARAAIAALREPTEAMIRAAGYPDVSVPAWMEAHDWPRMIDEALK